MQLRKIGRFTWNLERRDSDRHSQILHAKWKTNGCQKKYIDSCSLFMLEWVVCLSLYRVIDEMFNR